MAKTFLEVQQQIEQLQKEAKRLREKEAEGVLARIKEAIAIYEFTPADLGFGQPGRKPAKTVSGDSKKARKPLKTSASSEPKFRDDQGNVWSGRGPRPAWFKAALEAGKSANDLLAN